MTRAKIIINAMLLLLSIATAAKERKFPDDFSFGTGTSAYQTEGAWNSDGKSENIWDHWIHKDPSHIKNNATADDASGAYRIHYLDLLKLMNLKVQHYRFSIPWSRILPKGHAEEINLKAVMHYQELIREYHFINITPVVTLYYHDLPQSLQDLGGWANPEMVKYFLDYARICFQYFPDVEYWITFNDPRAICRKGYGDGSFAPGITSDGIGEYRCAYTVLKAHAAAYHLYKEEFQLNGKISIAIDLDWSEPASTDDTAAVDRRNAFEFGLYANPIYSGNWPQEVIDRVDYRSSKEKFEKSRLPKFTDDEIKYINGTSDFMAINFYDTHIVKDVEEDEFGNPSYIKDMKAEVYRNSSWVIAENNKPIFPESATKALVWLKSTFNDPVIFITENGVADNEYFYDDVRMRYLQDYLNAILDAIIEDGVKVIAYTAWSLMDGFEWTDGYSYRSGFYYVNFQSDERSKLEKQSVFYYSLICDQFTIPEEIPTTTSTTTSTTTTTTTSTTTTEKAGGSATKIVLCPVLILTVFFLLQSIL